MPRGLTTLFILPGAVLFVLFFLTPLASVGGEAFDDGGSAFHRAMGDPLFWRALAGTLSIGITASLASVAVGLCVALHLSTLRERSRALVLLVISLPLTFSGLIVAYGFILLIGRSGFVTLSIAGLTGADPAIIGSFLFTPAGVALAYCYYLVPRAVLILLPAILNFDAGRGAGRTVPRSDAFSGDRRNPAAADRAEHRNRALDDGGGRHGRLWHGAGAGRHSIQYFAVAALQQDFGDGHGPACRCRHVDGVDGALLPADRDRRGAERFAQEKPVDRTPPKFCGCRPMNGLRRLQRSSVTPSRCLLPSRCGPACGREQQISASPVSIGATGSPA